MVKFPIKFPLFSTVKLKLGHNFPQFIHRSKIRTLGCWSWTVPPILFSIHKEIENWDFLMLL